MVVVVVVVVVSYKRRRSSSKSSSRKKTAVVLMYYLCYGYSDKIIVLVVQLRKSHAAATYILPLSIIAPLHRQ